MNFIDAVKFGYPMRPAGSIKEWYVYRQEVERAWLEGIGPFTHAYQTSCMYLTPAVIQLDWEVKEPSVTVTAKQFWTAFRECPVGGDVVQYIADRLGVGERA